MYRLDDGGAESLSRGRDDRSAQATVSATAAVSRSTGKFRVDNNVKYRWNVDVARSWSSVAAGGLNPHVCG